MNNLIGFSEQQASTSHVAQSESPKVSKKAFGGVLRENAFNRMSFNTKLNRDKKDKDKEQREQLEPVIEQSNQEESSGGGHTSTSPPRNRGISPPSPPTKRRGSVQQIVETSPSKPTTTHVSNLNKGWNQQLPAMPASASLATAMYPPMKPQKPAHSNPKIQETIKKSRGRASSVDIEHGTIPAHFILPPKKLSEKTKHTTAFPVNVSPTPQLPMPQNLPSRSDTVVRPQMAFISNNNPGDVAYFQAIQQPSPQTVRRKMTDAQSLENMASRLLQLRARGGSIDIPSLHPGPSTSSGHVTNNNGSINTGKVLDPDSVKGRTLQAYEAQLLSDPNILAKLTRLPPHMQQSSQPPSTSLTGSGGSNSGSELDQSTVTVLHLPNGVP
uniref:Uncharacterized protein n=1 Tax=Panagrolaimus sp. JU765 TaxID=591449 RepID=A0AC34RFA9_9BILA